MRLLVAVRADPDGWADLLRADLPEHEVLTAVPDDGGSVPVLVAGVPPIGLVARLTGLRLVLSVNAGVDGLLAGGEVPASIPIVRMVDPGLVDGMVEWVAARVLAWHRNLFAYRDQQRDGLWRPRPERFARERTVTVLGAGELGRPVAAMLARLGFRTRIWSRSPRAVEGVEAFAGAAALHDAVQGADILVGLLPATPATRDLIDGPLLSAMNPGGFLVNGGRGTAVNEADLLAALADGRLDAAALDVFRNEPPPPAHPFWSHPRLFMTPHVAAITHPRSAAAVLAATVRRFERGEPLPHLVDRAKGY